MSDRLSQWIDWTHAVALSTALDEPAASAGEPFPAGVDADECTRVRASLTGTILADRAFSVPAPATPAPAEETAGEGEFEYPFFRQRYLSLQQSMETKIGHLRGRLREMLSLATDDAARLAAVDAVMERALGRRERMLLSTVPALLGTHFERLRQAGQPASAETPAAAWREVFRRDMQNVLLAELDVRLQPAEGLLAALRTSQLGSHVQKSA